MAHRSTFRMYPTGISALLASPQMIAGIRLITETHLKPTAESIAPIGTPPDDPHPTLYQRSFRVVDRSHWVTRTRYYGSQPRAQISLINTAPHALGIEFGNRNITARHTIQRACALAAVTP
ncbi:hypothetical protein ACFRCG_41865 [Embleya sp. NPDC056575]|uniref:hypothetical protein n=1 Tax=unclassified Embleya TaxID=2699296 RepID=UPI00368E5D42